MTQQYTTKRFAIEKESNHHFLFWLFPELYFFFLFLNSGFVASLNCSSPTPESLFEALETEIFSKKLYRPVKYFSQPLNVSVDMTVVGILGVQWDIDGLSWDEKECGTRRVSVPREKFWVPDVHIAEFMDEDKSPQTPYVYLHNTGRVYDDKPLRVVSSCKLGIYSFPFDIQNCSLTFGSYIHFDIVMFQASKTADILEESIQVAQTKGEWELINIQSAPYTLELTDGNYSEIKYHIILRRRPILYVVNLIVPSIFLMTLDIFSFLLPPQTVDRSAFKMTLILGYTVFLLLMNDLLPVTGNETPLLSESDFHKVKLTSYYSHNDRHTKELLTVSTSDDSQPVSSPQEPALDELRKLRRDLKSIRLQMDKHFHKSKTSQDWNMIGVVIDRLLFGMYIVFFCVSVITITIIWSLSRYHPQ
uniref:Uncharacterized protein n=1 Tax=Mola mola TaxID=94237 RepID=A0A3Q3WAX6_MOLML